jgi:hypothetical protein
MLTLGQAACLVLGMEPTTENRTKAKYLLEQTPFTVTYFSGANPMEPVAMGMSVVKQTHSNTESTLKRHQETQGVVRTFKPFPHLIYWHQYKIPMVCCVCS